VITHKFTDIKITLNGQVLEHVGSFEYRMGAGAVLAPCMGATRGTITGTMDPGSARTLMAVVRSPAEPMRVKRGRGGRRKRRGGCK
jgi:hypothetical protein